MDKYARDDKLYPKDLKLRAKCNQRMFFDAASLFTRFRDCNFHIFFKGGKEISEDKLEYFHTSYDILEAFLASDPFLVGKNVTIADISAATTIISMEYYVAIKVDKHPRIAAWLKRLRVAIPAFDEVNAEIVQRLNELISSTWESNKLK